MPSDFRSINCFRLCISTPRIKIMFMKPNCSLSHVQRTIMIEHICLLLETRFGLEHCICNLLTIFPKSLRTHPKAISLEKTGGGSVTATSRRLPPARGVGARSTKQPYSGVAEPAAVRTLAPAPVLAAERTRGCFRKSHFDRFNSLKIFIRKCVVSIVRVSLFRF